MQLKVLDYDPMLAPYASALERRMDLYNEKKAQLVPEGGSLADFANGHLYFGFHPAEDGWYYREWAPGAQEIYLTGDFNGWDRRSHPLTPKGNGVFELFLPGKDALKRGMQVLCVVVHDGQELDRIPLYADRVVQDPVTTGWNAMIWGSRDYPWTDKGFCPKKTLYIYECHIGMAQEEGKVGTYEEFRRNVLPRVKNLGYNALQIMAIMEHPYYASFGYQVTNLFAPSSRFGTPEELKALINDAHKMGIAVLLDVVHSHAAKNTREGINEFDGTTYQFFHDGGRGDHSAWGTKCFDYGKNEVIHFLLSNLKYWQDVYHFDGFRFDGVTSMLYKDHGLGTAFTEYDKYFSGNTDEDAVTYLQLANEMVHYVNPNAITIAEDTSALPGLCLPICDGGVGFDYRLAMGHPDLWVRLLEGVRDEDWDLNQIYYELASQRPNERVIGYCESHDQALVGEKTIMFRLCDKEMYEHMHKDDRNDRVYRGMALHKMLRLINITLGGQGYLNFMGNEFGHPEWIDFPREGNGWSHHYCRRQWSLADNPDLKYQYLEEFDRAMVELCKKHRLPSSRDRQLYLSNEEKLVIYQKGKVLLAFNFHPANAYDGVFIPVPKAGSYRVILSTDDYRFGGDGRIYHQSYESVKENGRHGIRLYLPSRTAAVLVEEK